MNIEWLQVVPTASIFLGIGWFLRYVFVRWYEKRHLDEELDRGTKAILIAEKLFELHEKSCDRNVNLKIPLGRKIVELLPITDDELAEDELELLERMEIGQYWLISLMWHCINLIHAKGELITVDDAIEHAEECFVSAYGDMCAQDLMRDFGDITITHIVHSYYGYLTQKTEANADALIKAIENWAEAHADDEDADQSNTENL